MSTQDSELSLTNVERYTGYAPIQQSTGMAVASPPVRRLLKPPPSWPPTLVVVVDTEEEFNWQAPFDPASTRITNILLQPLAQRILDVHQVVPTYVVDYPVASTPESVAVLGEIAGSGRCEIGAHLHPWVNPPAEGPIDTEHSYAGNLPAEIERRKLEALTATITASFGKRPTVYKAGRFGIGTATPQILRDLDYSVDASVVPHTDFSADGGPDFRGAPTVPFLIADGVCEVPMSVHFVGALAAFGPRLYPALCYTPLGRIRPIDICGKLHLLARHRLTPEGHTLQEMVRQTRAAFAKGERLFTLTYHSSTMLPGSTAYVRNERQREAFLEVLDRYLGFFLNDFGGRARTIREVAKALTGSPPAGGDAPA